MRKILIGSSCLIVAMMFSLALGAQTFHALSLQTTGDSTVALTTLQGKRVVVIIAATDVTSDTTGLATIQQHFSDLVVIELPVQQLAQSNTIVPRIGSTNWWVATPTQDSTDVNGLLLRWLTSKDSNQHFELEELQVGQKLFIDSSGELYAILPATFLWSNPRMGTVLTRNSLPVSQ